MKSNIDLHSEKEIESLRLELTNVKAKKEAEYDMLSKKVKTLATELSLDIDKLNTTFLKEYISSLEVSIEKSSKELEDLLTSYENLEASNM
jgi:hypothetical protein|nr:MAG TPA: hypothetical protein [Caudoviricetes sp.]